MGLSYSWSISQVLWIDSVTVWNVEGEANILWIQKSDGAISTATECCTWMHLSARAKTDMKFNFLQA